LKKGILVALILSVLITLSSICFQHVEAEVNYVLGEANFNASAYAEYDVTDTMRVRRKDGTWIECSGRQVIRIWGDMRGNIVYRAQGQRGVEIREWKLGGIYDSSSTGRLRFEEGLASGDNTVYVYGGLSGLAYDRSIDDPDIADCTNCDTVVHGPSVDFLSGLAETGPWNIFCDPRIYPVDGSRYIVNRTFRITFGIWFDAPNLRRANCSLIPMIVNANGTYVIIEEKGQYVGVGGIVVPVDKLALLAPYIGLASIILVAAVATAIYVKRVKHKKENQ